MCRLGGGQRGAADGLAHVRGGVGVVPQRLMVDAAHHLTTAVRGAHCHAKHFHGELVELRHSTHRVDLWVFQFQFLVLLLISDSPVPLVLLLFCLQLLH